MSFDNDLIFCYDFYGDNKVKKDKRGFTLVEILTVLVILSILMAVAVPSIMGISKKLKIRGLESKVEAIEEAAVVYAQNNSNKIKAQLGGSCKQPGSHCECEKHDEATNTWKDCKYVFTKTVDELIELGAYKTEKGNDLDSTCDVVDPRDANYCLDCVLVTIKLDDDYKTATADLNIDDIKDGKTVCE